MGIGKITRKLGKVGALLEVAGYVIAGGKLLVREMKGKPSPVPLPAPDPAQDIDDQKDADRGSGDN